MKRREFIQKTFAGAAVAAAGSVAVRARASEAAFAQNKVLKLAGTTASASSNYTRMFPNLPPQGANNPHLEEGLIRLGGRMRDDSNEPPSQLDKLMGAGYTYLGQFIDHDLTFDIIPLHAVNPDAEQRQNYRRPFLDLDQLYGGGPTLAPFLYHNRHQDRGQEVFLIGRTQKPSGPTPTATPMSTPTPTPSSEDELGDDLPRNSEGIALVGDPRQDENLIIAQLHVAFLRVHNSVLKKLQRGELKSCGPDGASCFEQARRLVTWHYQWIVRHEYLEKILDADVFADVAKPDYKPWMAGSGAFRIPIEFSGAAFRFGHSMVLNQYDINTGHSGVPLKTLLSLTGFGGKARPSLPAEWKIDWKNFFEVGGGASTVRKSNPIDTSIAGGLYQFSKDTQADLKGLFAAPMPGESQQYKAPPPKPEEDDLPVINLLRGARMGLPSGQEVAKALAVKRPLCEEEIKKGPHEETLLKYNFHQDTPLWYYILKEAELRGNGCRLGPVGSKIVRDVIIGALLNDEDSYVSANTSGVWQPTLPVCIGGPSQFRMSDLIRFSKDPDWDKKTPC